MKLLAPLRFECTFTLKGTGEFPVGTLVDHQITPLSESDSQAIDRCSDEREISFRKFFPDERIREIDIPGWELVHMETQRLDRSCFRKWSEERVFRASHNFWTLADAADMLRYENCFPISLEDGILTVRKLWPYKKMPWADGRWKSFGWEVAS